MANDWPDMANIWQGVGVGKRSDLPFPFSFMHLATPSSASSSSGKGLSGQTRKDWAVACFSDEVQTDCGPAGSIKKAERTLKCYQTNPPPAAAINSPSAQSLHGRPKPKVPPMSKKLSS